MHVRQTLRIHLLGGILLLFFLPWTQATPIPDAVLNPDSIRQIFLQNPRYALALLDTAEQRQIPDMPLFQIDQLRSLCYETTGEYILMEKYARRALATDSVQQNPRRKLMLMTLLINSLNPQLQYAESIRLCQETIELARRLKNQKTEGQIWLIIGGVYAKMKLFEQAQEAYKQSLFCLDSTEPGTMPHLSAAYGSLMTLLMENGHLTEAIRTGMEREALVKKMSRMPGLPAGYIDQQYGYVYSKMAYLLQLDQQPEKAATYCRLFQKTRFSKEPDNQGEIIPYLLTANRHAEARKANEAALSHHARTAANDTVNYPYLILLERQADILRGLRQYQAADDWRQRCYILQDSIYVRERTGQAQELATAFRLNEKERQLHQAQADMQRRNLLLGISIILFILVLAILLIIGRNLHATRRRNRLLARQLDELQVQREELYKTVAHTHPSDGETAHDATDGTAGADGDAASAKDSSTEYIQFLRMEQYVTEKHLFLHPGFGRDDLLGIVRINKNDLPRLLRKYAHAENVNDYLNRLRVQHALKLIQEKPHFSIQAIGEEAGFRSRTTFYRAFLKECGMTPAQYMQSHQ